MLNLKNISLLLIIIIAILIPVYAYRLKKSINAEKPLTEEQKTILLEELSKDNQILTEEEIRERELLLESLSEGGVLTKDEEIERIKLLEELQSYN